MATKIVSKVKAEDAVQYVSTSRKSDYKAIKLKKDGKIYVEHVSLADSLIKKGVATEAKDVDFEVKPPHIKFVSEV